MKKHTLLTAAFLLVASTLSFAAGPFAEKDFTWDVATSLHKDVIIAGVNKIARDDPRCTEINPASARIDYEHGSPDDMAFAVTCGGSDKPVTVSFTELEAQAEISHAAHK